jgi:hypothetical protein
MSRDPKTTSGHGFNPFDESRKPWIVCMPAPGPIKAGIFAVQHLRIHRNWLNSMQPWAGA